MVMRPIEMLYELVCLRCLNSIKHPFMSIVSSIQNTLYQDNYLSIGFGKKQGTIKESEEERRYEQRIADVRAGLLNDNIDNTWRSIDLGERPKNGQQYILDKSPESSQAKKRYGTQGICRGGARKVKAGSALLQKHFGKRRLGFCTLTLPNFRAVEIKWLAVHWGKVCRVFFQKLKRMLEKKGAPNIVLSVTEIQPQRYKKFGHIAPHLHFVFIAKPKASDRYYLSTSDIRDVWNSVLVGYIQKMFPFTAKPAYLKASCKLQPIYKDVTKYLSKYLSKGGEIVDDIREKGREKELPNQWWNSSRLMKALYLKTLKRIPDSLAWEIYKNPDEFYEGGVLSWYSYVEVEIDGESKTVGLVAYLASDDMRQGIEVSY